MEAEAWLLIGTECCTAGTYSKCMLAQPSQPGAAQSPFLTTPEASNCAIKRVSATSSEPAQFLSVVNDTDDAAAATAAADDDDDDNNGWR